MITLAGEQLLTDAKNILHLSEQAKVQVKRAHNGQVGTINIAYLGSACLAFMADLVSRYKAQFPYVHISLFEMTVTEQIEALKNNKIDVGFSRPLPSSIANDYTSHRIYLDKLVAIVPEHHLLGDNENIDLSQLKNAPFVLFNREEAMGLFDETLIQCKHAGFSPNIISQPRNMQTLLTEVAAGLGISVAPNCVRKLYSKGCHFIKLNNINTEIPVHLHHKNNADSATINAFVAIALEARAKIQRDMLE